jgi:hypothetical protein
LGSCAGRWPRAPRRACTCAGARWRNCARLVAGKEGRRATGEGMIIGGPSSSLFTPQPKRLMIAAAYYCISYFLLFTRTRTLVTEWIHGHGVWGISDLLELSSPNGYIVIRAVEQEGALNGPGAPHPHTAREIRTGTVPGYSDMDSVFHSLYYTPIIPGHVYRSSIYKYDTSIEELFSLFR